MIEMEKDALWPPNDLLLGRGWWLYKTPPALSLPLVKNDVFEASLMLERIDGLT